MGFELRIPGVRFGMDNDDLLVDGSLLLVEPGSSVNPWAGVPAHGAAIPNLAASRANALVGADVSTLIFERTMVGDEGIVERSGAGGLHVAEVYGKGVSNHRVILRTLNTLRDYLDAHQGDDLYLCTWGKNTRLADPSLGQILHASLAGASGTRLGVGHLPASGALSAAPSSSDARRLGFRIDQDQGAAYQSVAARGVPASGWALPHGVSVFTGGPIGAAQVGKSPGYLLWWLYLENLTVSKRTFAQVDAIAHRYYTQQVLQSSGKYHADTYTQPV